MKELYLTEEINGIPRSQLEEMIGRMIEQFSGLAVSHTDRMRYNFIQ